MTNLFEIDQQLFRAIHLGWHSSFLDYVFLVLSYIGLGQVQVALALLSRIWTKQFVWPLVCSVLITGLGFAQLLKALIPRDRPSLLWDAHPQEGFRYSSFPSGHTTTAFAVSVTILLFARTQRERTFAWICVVVSVGVAISRIYRGVHWPSDVFAGACAGTLGASILYALWPAPKVEPIAAA